MNATCGLCEFDSCEITSMSDELDDECRNNSELQVTAGKQVLVRRFI